MWWLTGLALAAPRPLYAVRHDCDDDRYPALAGEWVAACGPNGQVDRVISLNGGAELRLPFAATSPGLASDTVYAPGLDGGMAMVVMDAIDASEDLTRVVDALVAPPATDGIHIAVLGRDYLEAFAATERQRRRISARPAGWYPPALAWPWVAWVEDAGPDGEDVRAVNMLKQDPPMTIAGGPGYQRHVVGDGTHLAWVEEDAVVLWDTDTDERRRIPAKTGFNAPITLSDGVVCWESRDGVDVDIACSDGLVVQRPGDQLWPSREGPWLLFREGDVSWVVRAGAP